MTAVRFDRRGGDIYAVTFTYDPVVVEMLKLIVPSYARSWNPVRREWLIETVYGKPLADVLTNLGCTVVGLDKTAPAAQCDSWARHLYRAVGPHRVPAVHRALTKVLHPDNTDTGSHELQRELNDARAELEAP